MPSWLLYILFRLAQALWSLLKADVHVAQTVAESFEAQTLKVAAGLALTMAGSESGSTIPGNGSATGKPTFSGTATRRALTSVSTAAATGPVGTMKTTTATVATGHTTTTGGGHCLSWPACRAHWGWPYRGSCRTDGAMGLPALSRSAASRSVPNFTWCSKAPSTS